MGLLLVLLLGGALGLTPPFYQDHDFSYSVEDNSSGNQFGHSETSHAGDTAGTYHVLLPDGRLQTVEYTVRRHGGFQATVQYLGLASVETLPSVPRSVYQPVDLAYSYPVPPTTPPYPSPAPYAPPPPAPYAPPPPPAPYSPAPPPPPSQWRHTAIPPSFTAFHPSPSQQPLHLSEPIVQPQPPPPPPAPTPPPPPPPPPPPAPLQAYSPQATSPHSTIYRPLSYQPAPVTRFDPHVHNLLLSSPLPHPHHHLATPHIAPLAPPEHLEEGEEESSTKDPFLMTEEEIKTEGRDFTGPFWYPQHRKILRGYRKRPKEHPEEEEGGNHL